MTNFKIQIIKKSYTDNLKLVLMNVLFAIYLKDTTGNDLHQHCICTNLMSAQLITIQNKFKYHLMYTHSDYKHI